jgi:hypothetical protein
MDRATLSMVRFALCALLLAGLLWGLFWVGRDGRVSSTDDWRRTANGWERTSNWSSTAWGATNRQVGESQTGFVIRALNHRRRIDAHPAALALLQLIGSMLALAAFSPRGREILTDRPFFALIARSFRASVFGS